MRRNLVSSIVLIGCCIKMAQGACSDHYTPYTATNVSPESIEFLVEGTEDTGEDVCLISCKISPEGDYPYVIVYHNGVESGDLLTVFYDGLVPKWTGSDVETLADVDFGNDVIGIGCKMSQTETTTLPQIVKTTTQTVTTAPAQAACTDHYTPYTATNISPEYIDLTDDRAETGEALCLIDCLKSPHGFTDIVVLHNGVESGPLMNLYYDGLVQKWTGESIDIETLNDMDFGNDVIGVGCKSRETPTTTTQTPITPTPTPSTPTQTPTTPSQTPTTPTPTPSTMTQSPITPTQTPTTPTQTPKTATQPPTTPPQTAKTSPKNIYGTCFIPETTSVVKKAISVITKDTQRDCELACEAKAECFSIRYDTTKKSCFLEKNENVPTCTASRTHYVKVVLTEPPKRKDPMAEMGVDPCVKKYRPELTKFNAPNPCPPRNLDGSDGPLLALRGVLENGTRVTLTDEYAASLSYDKCTDTWVHLVKNEHLSLQTRLHAVTCAEFDNKKCPCAPIHYPSVMVNPKPITVDKLPSCPGWIEVKYISLPWDYSYSNANVALVKCKAGQWFLSYRPETPEKREQLFTEGGC